jgi:hypothetical protein
MLGAVRVLIAIVLSIVVVFALTFALDGGEIENPGSTLIVAAVVAAVNGFFEYRRGRRL